LLDEKSYRQRQEKAVVAFRHSMQKPSLLRKGSFEKIGLHLFPSFRRKPESSPAAGGFKPLKISWTPVFTGVDDEKQFFHTFGGQGGFGTGDFHLLKKAQAHRISPY